MTVLTDYIPFFAIPSLPMYYYHAALLADAFIRHVLSYWPRLQSVKAP